MLEIIIERWSNPDGSTDYLWSLWQSGKRVHMGGRFSSADDARRQALEFCHDSVGASPDRVREL